MRNIGYIITVQYTNQLFFSHVHVQHPNAIQWLDDWCILRSVGTNEKLREKGGPGVVWCALPLCTCSCRIAPAQHRNATRVYTNPGLTIDTRLMKMKYVHFHCKLNSRNDCSVHAAFPKITKLAFAMFAIRRGSYRPAYKLGSHNTGMWVIGGGFHKR